MLMQVFVVYPRFCSVLFFLNPLHPLFNFFFMQNCSLYYSIRNDFLIGDSVWVIARIDPAPTSPRPVTPVSLLPPLQNLDQSEAEGEPWTEVLLLNFFIVNNVEIPSGILLHASLGRMCHSFWLRYSRTEIVSYCCFKWALYMMSIVFSH